MARRATRDRRSSGDARRWLRARPRRGHVHRRFAVERDAAHRRPPVTACLGEGWPDRPRTCPCTARRARRGRAGRDPATRARVQLPGCRRRRGLRRHVRARPGGSRCDRGRLGGSRTATRSRRSGPEGLAARRAARAGARRLRARAGRRRRGRLRRVHDRRRPAQLDGDPPGGRPMGRRRGRGAHLDAVHLGNPRSGRRWPRAPARQGARDLPLHGGRIRLEERA